MNIKMINKQMFFLLFWVLLFTSCKSNPKVDNGIEPTDGQLAMIERKYGLFLHYGLNTYLNMQWSDGTDSASIYNPPADIGEQAANWVKIAKKAGMRSIVLTTKHHEGFCLWDSQYTTHDIANPAIEHKVDIVKAVADECANQGIAFSVYYSLWDRFDPSYKDEDKHKYIEFMKNQLGELMTNYGTVHELWFDGAWDRKVEDWYLQEVYDFVKELQPECQISTNWTLGKRPVDMQENDTIVYFPSDFRLWDPFLPMENDPKIYTYGDKKYYLPYESTQTISVLGNWFYFDGDQTVRDLEELEEIFYVSTINDNCLLLNIPPDKNGELNPLAIQRIYDLAELLGIEDGKEFPEKLNKPRSITSFAKANASSVHKLDTLHYGATYAVDSDVSTAWQADSNEAWLEVVLENESSFNQINIIEGGNNIQDYTLEIKEGSDWRVISSGAALSDATIPSFMGYGFSEIYLPEAVRAKELRLSINSSLNLPSIYSIRLKMNN